MILVTEANGHWAAVVCRLVSLENDEVAMVRDIQAASGRLPTWLHMYGNVHIAVGCPKEMMSNRARTLVL
jgi:hypothetical protein